MRRALALIVVLGVLAIVALPWLVLDDTPSIEPPTALRRNDLAWVKSLFLKHDPRRLTPDVVHSIRLDEAELNRLLDYAVEIKAVRGVAAVLDPETATVSATLRVPKNPFGEYLNLVAELAQTPHGVELSGLELGSLPVPGVLADWLARRAHAYLLTDVTYAALADAYQTVHFSEGEATLDYRWHPELLTQIERKGAELLIPEADKTQMLAQAERLDALLAPYRHGATIPLVNILPKLFAESQTAYGDAAEENRGALTALAAYLAGISLPGLLEGDSTSIRRAPRINLTVHGRRDFAEHFSISAALTANAGSRFAGAIGLIKEEEDAGRGSGFSFTDLAANRAGIRLGEAIVGERAEVLQARLARIKTDAGLMPDFNGLPEFMAQAEFDRRFGPVGSARYQRVIDAIDARIAAHPLLR